MRQGKRLHGFRWRRGLALTACLLAAASAWLPAVGCRARSWQNTSPLLQQQIRSGEEAPWWIEQTPAEPGVAWYGVGSATFYEPVAMVQAPLVAEARARMAVAQRLRHVLRDASFALLQPVTGDQANEEARVLAEALARQAARDAAVVELWQDREQRTVYALARTLDSHILFRLLAEVRERWLGEAELDVAAVVGGSGETEEDDEDGEELARQQQRRLERAEARAAISLLATLPATAARVMLTSRQSGRGSRAWMAREMLWEDPLAWPARHEPGPADSGLLAGAQVYSARNEHALQTAEHAARLRLAIRTALVVQEAIVRLLERETDRQSDPRRRHGSGFVLDVAAAVGLEASARAQVRSLQLAPPGPMPELAHPTQRRHGGRSRSQADPAWSQLGLDPRLSESAWYTPQALRTRVNRAMVGVNLQALAYFTARGLVERLGELRNLSQGRELVNALRRLIEEARRDVLEEDRPSSPLRSPIDTPLEPFQPATPSGPTEEDPQAREGWPTLEIPSPASEESPREGRIHVLQGGESLRCLAEHYYGEARHWPHIAEANQLAEQNHVEPGMPLHIPPAPVEASTPNE